MTTVPIVLDTNVFSVSLVDENKLNVEERGQRQSAMTYIDGMVHGRYLIHLPRIAIIEITGVIRAKTGVGVATAVKNRLAQWVSLGLIHLYDLQEVRMTSAIELVVQHNLSRRRSLSAPDATFIGLAEELGIPLISFEKYFETVSERAMVPL